jgi:hypothetical protein
VCPLEHAKTSVCCKLLAPAVLVLLVLGPKSRAGAQPGGAREATGNEAEGVNVAKGQCHHEFVHYPLLLELSFSCFVLLGICF